MSALTYPEPRMFTIDEYLILERNADYKSEFLNGHIYAMPGGTPAHSVISMNMGRILGNQLESGPCVVYSGDLKIGICLGWNPPHRNFFHRSSERGLVSYPDVMVACGELRFHDEHQDVVTNPTLIVEVLSPSTEDYDRKEKLPCYQQIASLQGILYVSQEAPRIQHHHRLGESWETTVAEGWESIISIPSLGVTLSLAQVYRNVKGIDPDRSRRLGIIES